MTGEEGGVARESPAPTQLNWWHVGGGTSGSYTTFTFIPQSGMLRRTGRTHWGTKHGRKSRFASLSPLSSNPLISSLSHHLSLPQIYFHTQWEICCILRGVASLCLDKNIKLIFLLVEASTVFSPKNAQKVPGKKSPPFASHATMLNLKDFACRLSTQIASHGKSRCFSVQGDVWGQLFRF